MRKTIAPLIVIDPKVRFGKPVIRGTRVAVETVVGHLAGGMAAEDVMREYDLTRREILAALRYAASRVAEERLMPT